MPRRTQLAPTIIALLGCVACVVWLGALATGVRDLDSSRTIAWEAIAPAADAPLRPWRHIVIHHSDSPRGTSTAIDHDHRSRTDQAGEPWEGIGYHFVIGNGQGMVLGQIDATFRWRRQRHGAHAGNDEYNQFGIGIVMIGDFEREPPSSAQFERCAQLCALLISRLRTLSVDDIVGHRDVKATACPGRFCDLDILRARIEELLPIYERQRRQAISP